MDFPDCGCGKRLPSAISFLCLILITTCLYLCLVRVIRQKFQWAKIKVELNTHGPPIRKALPFLFVAPLYSDCVHRLRNGFVSCSRRKKVWIFSSQADRVISQYRGQLDLYILVGLNLFPSNHSVI